MSEVEMIAGYNDGRRDYRDELPTNNNYSAAYNHGWKNGRDDRNKQPRDRAAVLRAQAELILQNS